MTGADQGQANSSNAVEAVGRPNEQASIPGTANDAVPDQATSSNAAAAPNISRAENMFPDLFKELNGSDHKERLAQFKENTASFNLELFSDELKKFDKKETKDLKNRIEAIMSLVGDGHEGMPDVPRLDKLNDLVRHHYFKTLK